MLNNIRIQLINALGGKPKTRIASGGNDKEFFGENRGRTPEQLKRQRTIYEQGGIVADALDCYPIFALRSGWRLEGEDQNLKDSVNEFLISTAVDIGVAMKQLETDAVVFGDGFAENVASRGGDIAGLVVRASDTFTIIHDDYGEITGYQQKISENTAIPLKPEQITNHKMIGLGGSMYGYSLIQRAYDDIIRDTKTMEGIAEGIKRHGTPKFHIQVGQVGENVSKDDITTVRKEFEKLAAKNDFVTNRDVIMNGLDAGGVPNVKEYADVSGVRMLGALGVPSELVGIRQGTTDNTAISRIDTFMGKVAWHQQQLAKCINLNVIDRFTNDPGAVTLILNDACPRDEAARAKWIAELLKATSLDPFAVLPRRWVQEQFDINPEAYADEEDDLPPMMDEETEGDIIE